MTELQVYDLIIEFAEWLRKNYLNSVIKETWYDLNTGDYFSTTDLLNKFIKQKENEQVKTQ